MRTFKVRFKDYRNSIEVQGNGIVCQDKIVGVFRDDIHEGTVTILNAFNVELVESITEVAKEPVMKLQDPLSLLGDKELGEIELDIKSLVIEAVEDLIDRTNSDINELEVIEEEFRLSVREQRQKSSLKVEVARLKELKRKIKEEL